jgi:hypothetical protein
MRQINITNNTSVYQTLLKSSDADRAGGPMNDQQLKALPKETYILTGDKTKEFGGGPSPYGFVMSGANKILGRVRLEGHTSPDGRFLVIR